MTSAVAPEAPESQVVDLSRNITTHSLETDSSEHYTSSDADSAIGSWRSSHTQSLTSSVVDFKFENGRRYHAYREGEYHLPNDAAEQDRLDLQHGLFRYALDGKLFRAPVEKERLHNILDVGCGTGLWAIDTADENLQAQVLGFDLSPIQPDTVPPNCKFLVDDVNADWLFNERFDLIHTRAMTPGIKDWPRYFEQAYAQLKPGGYIELHEVIAPTSCTEETKMVFGEPNFVRLTRLMVEATSTVGFKLDVPHEFPTLLQEAGFTNINIKWDKFPIGPWAKGKRNKEIGRWWAEDMKVAAWSVGKVFTGILGWTAEEHETLAANCVKEIDDIRGGVHMWQDVCFAYAQKPA